MSFLCKEFIMGSPLHNLSILQNQDFISVTDCADAVSDDNFCCVL